MKTTVHLKLGCMIAALCALAPATLAQTYNWLSWTFPSSQTASANAPGYGSVGVAVQGASTFTTPFAIQFDNLPFTPTSAGSVGAQNLGGHQLWTIQMDFLSFSDTTGLTLGIGNFGHGTADYPGYRLTALDILGMPMSLSGFTQIGSYDHTWTSQGGIQFNDDVSLNPATGVFNVTTIPGLQDRNSDILLLALPANVGQLFLTPIAPSAGDTINVLVAVPEPGTLALMLLGVGALSLLAWRRHAA